MGGRGACMHAWVSMHATYFWTNSMHSWAWHSILHEWALYYESAHGQRPLSALAAFGFTSKSKNSPTRHALFLHKLPFYAIYIGLNLNLMCLFDSIIAFAMLFAIIYMLFTICFCCWYADSNCFWWYLISAIRYLRFAICYLLSAFRYLLICYLLLVICYLLYTIYYLLCCCYAAILPACCKVGRLSKNCLISSRLCKQTSKPLHNLKIC